MNFENLEVWKRSAQLSAELYVYFKDLTDFGFKDQITRSGLSVPSNIAEGMARSSQQERKRFINIAQGSIAELKTQIWIGMKIEYIEKDKGKYFVNEASEIAAMLGGLHRTLSTDGCPLTASQKKTARRRFLSDLCTKQHEGFFLI